MLNLYFITFADEAMNGSGLAVRWTSKAATYSRFVYVWLGILKQGEGSDSLKTALETVRYWTVHIVTTKGFTKLRLVANLNETQVYPVLIYWNVNVNWLIILQYMNNADNMLINTWLQSYETIL